MFQLIYKFHHSIIIDLFHETDHADNVTFCQFNFQKYNKLQFNISLPSSSSEKSKLPIIILQLLGTIFLISS